MKRILVALALTLIAASSFAATGTYRNDAGQPENDNVVQTYA